MCSVRSPKTHIVMLGLALGIWIKDDIMQAIFEIEFTTTMTGALLRDSNVENSVDQFMVLLEERDK